MYIQRYIYICIYIYISSGGSGCASLRWKQPKRWKSRGLGYSATRKGFAGLYKDAILVLALPQERFEGINKDVVLVKALLEAAQLAQILIMSDLVVLVIEKASRSLQELQWPPESLQRPPARQPLEASRSPQAANHPK